MIHLTFLRVHCIKTTLIHYHIKCRSFVLHIKDVTDCIAHLREILLRFLSHFLDDLLRVIHVEDILVPSLVHFLREEWFPAADIEDTDVFRSEVLLKNPFYILKLCVPLKELLVTFLNFLEEGIPVLFLKEILFLFGENVHFISSQKN